MQAVSMRKRSQVWLENSGLKGSHVITGTEAEQFIGKNQGWQLTKAG